MKIKFNIHIMIVKVCENDNKKLDWELEHWPGPWPGPTWTWSLTIMPISHNTTQPPCPPSQNHNYRPSCLSAIIPIPPSDLCPAFATFKPFRLVFGTTYWLRHWFWSLLKFCSHVYKDCPFSHLWLKMYPITLNYWLLEYWN